MTQDKPKRKVGKPPYYEQAMRRYNVILDDLTVKIIKELTSGNLSKGIRKAAQIIKGKAV